MPKRIQMSRQQPWRAQNPTAVVVSRPTAFGNPFAIGGWYVIDAGDRYVPTRFPQFHEDAVRIPDAAAAVDLFRDYLDYEIELRQTIRKVLRGFDLACWCPLDQPCHADVLLEIANG